MLSRRLFLRGLGSLLVGATCPLKPAAGTSVAIGSGLMLRDYPLERAVIQPKFIGRTFELNDNSLFVRRESARLEFFAYATVGAAIVSCRAYDYSADLPKVIQAEF